MQPATKNQNLEQYFEEYSEWRTTLAAGVAELKSWLQQQELSDTQVDQRLEHVLSTTNCTSPLSPSSRAANPN